MQELFEPDGLNCHLQMQMGPSTLIDEKVGVQIYGNFRFERGLRSSRTQTRLCSAPTRATCRTGRPAKSVRYRRRALSSTLRCQLLRA